MNRAAEAAAPMASRYFGDAIRDMTLEDVRGILTGGNTAATEFFRAQDATTSSTRPSNRSFRRRSARSERHAPTRT